MIQVHQLTKSYPGPNGATINALGPMDLRVEPGEFVCIVGPSGCGKSTLLRLLAGLEPPTSGELTIGHRQPTHDPRPTCHPLGMVTPDNRSPTLVFQGDSTFPWMTVFGNVEYPLKLRGLGEKEREVSVMEMVGRVGLTKFAEAYPYQLSGGMKQRVALARAWANDPATLLMDEPFGALDEQTRITLQNELLRLWDATRKTVLFVTHSIDEALVLADRVLVMSSAPGRIVKEAGVPFARPREAIQLKRDPQFGELAYALWQALKG